MKSLLRHVILYAFALGILPHLFSGVHISGGILTYIFGGVILTLMMLILKPLLNLITFPLNMVTIGFFSVLTNLLILYLLTVFVPRISISAFVFPGTSFAGVIIPKMHVNEFFAYMLSGAIIAGLSAAIKWIVESLCNSKLKSSAWVEGLERSIFFTASKDILQI